MSLIDNETVLLKMHCALLNYFWVLKCNFKKEAFEATFQYHKMVPKILTIWEKNSLPPQKTVRNSLEKIFFFPIRQISRFFVEHFLFSIKTLRGRFLLMCRCHEKNLQNLNFEKYLLLHPSAERRVIYFSHVATLKRLLMSS